MEDRSEAQTRAFFFFQAEDGIRDTSVTGVQTCALPISGARTGARPARAGDPDGDRLPLRLRGRADGRQGGPSGAGAALSAGGGPAGGGRARRGGRDRKSVV